LELKKVASLDEFEGPRYSHHHILHLIRAGLTTSALAQTEMAEP
jgi:hypothetical protein